MQNIELKYKEKPELENTILIEGLPGVGNVGKLAAEHLKDEIDAEEFLEINSIYLPPQVLVKDDGTTTLVNNSLSYAKDVGEEDHDIIILTGHYQGMTPKGQYKLTDKILEIASDFDSDMIFSLGGYGQGEMVDEPRVLGAATNNDLVDKMKELDVTFSEEHPSSGIVGGSGLLLGLGEKFYDLDGICLMGETSGYFVDPGAAREVLEVLTDYIGADIGYEELDEKAEEVESLTSKVKDMDIGGSGMQQESGEKDLSYIG